MRQNSYLEPYRSASCLDIVLVFLLLFIYVTIEIRSVALIHAGYERELFSGDVTYIGQLTKTLILIGFVLLVSHLTQYSRKLFVKLVSDEVSPVFSGTV